MNKCFGIQVSWRKDFQNQSEGYTPFCCFNLRQRIYYSSILPAYKVEAMVPDPTQTVGTTSPDTSQNLIDSYLELKGFINKHLPEKFYIEGDPTRIDFTRQDILEVIGNVIHREYTKCFINRFDYYRNGCDPNKPLLFMVRLMRRVFNPFPKNPKHSQILPLLVGLMKSVRIRNTNKYFTVVYSKCCSVFIENEPFKTVLPLKPKDSWRVCPKLPVVGIAWMKLYRIC